jgi:hypothetical protein
MITCSARILITFYPDTSTESHCPPCSFSSITSSFLKYLKPSVKYVSFIAHTLPYFGNLGMIANLGHIVKQILLNIYNLLQLNWLQGVFGAENGGQEFFFGHISPSVKSRYELSHFFLLFV